jgi:peptidoglycan hydrolase CwlO-like protein
MKKIVLACFLFCLMISISYGSNPCHEDCSSTTQQEQETAKNKIEQAYEKLINKLNNDLVPAYNNYQKATDNQTKLLEKVQTLKARNALLEKQILFLRTQDKELVGLSVDGASTKKGAK